ncbi:MAG: protein-L-isoaspartate O-methyltransferase [Thermoplasmata archaeon]|nr:protein-L-isoaspartate O-methyltransferase [Thermoplasmata archaeon]
MSDDWETSARRMVKGLGGVPPGIASAMRSVPRHWFVPVEHQRRAYDDEPVPLASGFATVSAPHMVAMQLEAAGVRPGRNLLEIGSGSGYLLAVAAPLAGPSAHLVGVELDPTLAAQSRHVLARLGVDATIRIRDGRESVPEGAVFDSVIVSFASPQLLPTWIAALSEGGRLVAPIGDAHSQILTTYRRDGATGSITHGPVCRFVPLRPHI